jgi:hypothetical protein
MTKKRKKLRGTVSKAIKTYRGTEKAEIDISEADDLYREIRVDVAAKLRKPTVGLSVNHHPM